MNFAASSKHAPAQNAVRYTLDNRKSDTSFRGTARKSPAESIK
jgi:hypothetical protein